MNEERLRELEEFGSEIIKLVREAGRSSFISKNEVDRLIEIYHVKLK